MAPSILHELNQLSGRPGTPKLPLLFLGHGSPMNAIAENEFTQGFRTASGDIARPSAIVCVSAHWETNGTRVTAMKQPHTIHDFSGFPKELYEVQYPAPGDPELAQEMGAMNTISHITLDHAWGLDHGAWSVIRHLYPKADIPVVQLSLDRGKSAREHYELAGELASLRRKGVLVIGSGNMVHNLGMLAWDRINDAAYGYDWALEASEKMKGFIAEGDHQSLVDYPSQGRSFMLSIPTPEHFLPLLYVLAMKDKHEDLSFFNDKAVGGSLTMTSVRIGH